MQARSHAQVLSAKKGRGVEAYRRWLDTERGYVLIEFSHIYGSYVWTCEWGHRAIDFESEAEALRDFERHVCDRSI